MEPTETPDPTTPVAPDRGRRMRSTIVAVGAAFGMTLAGLGIAQAQTSGGDGTTTTAPPAAESSEPTPDGGPGPGPGRCHHGHPLAKAGLTAAAETIGVTVEELRTALEGGQSIAQVAESKDVPVQSVIDAMVAEAKEKLAEAVESGRITQAQADQRLEELEARITELVNREGLPARSGPGPRPESTPTA